MVLLCLVGLIRLVSEVFSFLAVRGNNGMISSWPGKAVCPEWQHLPFPLLGLVEDM